MNLISSKVKRLASKSPPHFSSHNINYVLFIKAAVESVGSFSDVTALFETWAFEEYANTYFAD